MSFPVGTVTSSGISFTC